MLLALIVFFSARSEAQTSWTTAAAGNWNTDASWTPAVVPGVGINAAIINAGTFTVTYNSPMAAASIASLTLGSATSLPTLTISAPGFNVTGTTTLADSAAEILNINSGGVMNNGTLNLNSRNALVNINSGGTITNGNTQIANNGSNDGPGRLQINAGATASLGDVTVGRHNDSTAFGLQIAGGTVFASSIDVGTRNSYSTMAVSGGAITNAGNLRLGTGTATAGRPTRYQQTGGTVGVAGTVDLAVTANYTTAFSVLNAASTFFAEGIRIFPNAVSGVVARLTNSGSIYLGAGGLNVLNAGTYTVSLNNQSLLGATADWSANVNIVSPASSTITFRAADPIGTARNLTLSGNLSGGANLTKTGSGTLALNGANTYAGNTVVSAGQLVLGNNSALPKTTGLSLGGVGTAGLVDLAGFNAQIGGLAVSAGAVVANQLITNSSAVNFSTLTFSNSAANSTFGGVIAGGSRPIALTVLGGNLTLSGQNSYGGNLFISNGKLALSNAGSTFNGAEIVLSNATAILDLASMGGVSLGAGQSLSGYGIVTGSVTAANCPITPGTNGGAGTLVISGDLALNGNVTNQFDLLTDPNAAGGDQILVTGALNVSGVNRIRINPLTGSLLEGTFRLIQSALAGSGDTNNFQLLGSPGPGLQAALSVTTNGVDLIVTQSDGSSRVWVGDGVANLWDTATTNWRNASVPDTFTNGNFVRFDDAGSTTPAVNLIGALAPNSVTVDAAADYTFAGGGKITGAAVLIKDNTGTLTVLTTNDNSGLTIINSGTVQIGNGSSGGALGANVIQNHGTLIWNLPGNFTPGVGVTGTGRFVQAGSGVLTVAGSNSYTGGTTISGGTLQLANGGALGTGGISNNAALIFNSSASATINQTIAGTGSLTLLGSGTVTLPANNTFSGGSSISNGTLMVNNPSGSGAGSGAVNVFSGGKLAGSGRIGGPVTIHSGGSLLPGNSVGTLTINNTLTVNPGAILNFGLGSTSDRIVVNGNLNLSGTLTVTNAGGLVINSNYTLFTYTGALTLGTLTLGPMPVGFSGTITTNTPGKVELVTAYAFTGLPAFPGAEGAGAYALGGRGGDVYHVVNLNSSGPGSLNEGLATVPGSGRTIVFDVSGYINISGTLTLNASKVTIAGQTAPGDGIGVKNGTFRLVKNDVIIRHFRFRNGNSADSVNVDGTSTNTIFDHTDMLLSNDENFSSFNSPPENMTFQWSVNAWGMETHSAGGLWDQRHATAHHTLWSHNHTRNPKARPDDCLDWINNVTFDWDIGFIMGDSETPANWKANVRGCYFVCPPGNIRSVALQTATLDRNGNPNFFLYLDDCKMDDNGNGVLDFNPAKVGYALASGQYATSPTPFPNNGIPVTRVDPLTAYKKIVSAAGPLRLNANLPLRDEISSILISNLVNQIPHHVSSPTQTGAANGGYGFLNSAPVPLDTDQDGMPDYWELATGSNPNVQDHNNPIPANAFLPNTIAGYTLLEDYLHFLALPHTVISNQTFVDVDLRKFTSGFNVGPVFTFSSVSNGIVALQPNGYTARFTPTPGYTGRARFDFTVTDSAGSTWTQTFAVLVIDPPFVAPATPPTIGSINLSGSNLIVSGSGGPANGNYYVLTATNVALPVANWSRIATNPFSGTGTFAFTNVFSPGTPQQFFRLQLP